MAQYEMQESNLPNNEGKRILYPRMRLTGQDDLKEIARKISRASTFTPGDIVGLVQGLAEEIAFSMAEGRSVKIDGLGIFTPALGLRKGFERETGEPGSTRRNAMSIYVSGIRFKPDKALLADTNGHCYLERSPRKFRRSSQKYTPEQRLRLAQDYLTEHAYMTVADYEQLTGLLHSSAARELKRWCEQEGSGIGHEGRGTHRVYVRNNHKP